MVNTELETYLAELYSPSLFTQTQSHYFIKPVCVLCLTSTDSHIYMRMPTCLSRRKKEVESCRNHVHQLHTQEMALRTENCFYFTLNRPDLTTVGSTHRQYRLTLNRSYFAFAEASPHLKAQDQLHQELFTFPTKQEKYYLRGGGGEEAVYAMHMNHITNSTEQPPFLRSRSVGEEIFHLYETRRFTTVFTTDRPWNLSRCSRIRLTISHSISVRFILILASYPYPSLLCLFQSYIPTKTTYAFLIYHPSHFP
jgi:hypothetical protein